MKPTELIAFRTGSSPTAVILRWERDNHAKCCSHTRGQRTSRSQCSCVMAQERASHEAKLQKDLDAAAAELRQALAAKEVEAQRCAGNLAKLQAEIRAERQKAAAAEARLAAEQRYIMPSPRGLFKQSPFSPAGLASVHQRCMRFVLLLVLLEFLRWGGLLQCCLKHMADSLTPNTHVAGQRTLHRLFPEHSSKSSSNWALGLYMYRTHWHHRDTSLVQRQRLWRSMERLMKRLLCRRLEAALEAERAAARQAACAASTDAAEARRQASNEAHRLKTRLAAAAKKATESKEEAARLAAQLQVPPALPALAGTVHLLCLHMWNMFHCESSSDLLCS